MSTDGSVDFVRRRFPEVRVLPEALGKRLSRQPYYVVSGREVLARSQKV